MSLARCKCGAEFRQFNSLQRKCPRCTAKTGKPLKQTTGLKTTKRMKRIGRIGKALIDQAARFRKENSGPQQCFYCEYMGIIELIDTYNVEHPYSKTRHPGMRFDYDKLIVGCPGHNEQKGSLDIEDYLKKLDKEKEKWQETN